MSYKFKIKILAFISCICLFPHILNASDGKYYIKAETGVSLFRQFKNVNYVTNPNNKMHFGFGFGKQLSKDFNFELATHHHHIKFEEIGDNTVYSQNFDIHSGFINVQYHIMQYGKIIPYITFGAGATYNKAYTYKAIGKNSCTYKGNTRINPAYNIGAGVKINMNDNSDIMVGYKYYYLGKAKTKSAMITSRKTSEINPISTRLNHHAFTVGVIFYF